MHMHDEPISSHIKGRKSIFYFVLFCITGALFVRDVLGVEINKYLFLTGYIFAFFIFNFEDICGLLIFSAPLFYGLPNTYIYAIGAVFLLVKGYGSLNYRFLVFPLLLACQELLLAFSYPAIDMTDEVSFISCLFMFAALLCSDRSRPRHFLLMYVLGVTCAFVIVVGNTGREVGYNVLLTGGIRLGYDADAMNAIGSAAKGISLKFNPNEIGYFSIAAVAISLLLFLKTQTNRVLLGACSAVCVVSGLLSQSRTWLILFALLVAVQLMVNIKSVEAMRRTFVIAVLCVLAAVVFLQANSDVWNQIVLRFKDGNLASAGGRTQLFSLYNQYLESNTFRFLFGSGAVGYKIVTGIPFSTHNGFQQLVVCFGVLGAAFFVAMLCVALIKAKGGKSFSLNYWLPLFIVVLFIQSVQLVNPWTLMLPLVCGVAAIQMSPSCDCPASHRTTTGRIKASGK